MGLIVKICGICDRPALEAAVDGGADMLGFVFFPDSPRYITPEKARGLAGPAVGTAERVALTVDADDRTLEGIASAFKPDFWQCHGREGPARIAQIRARYGLPVIKAVAPGADEDVEVAACYRDVADMILFDAPPPAGSARPGGHGRPFAWDRLDLGRLKGDFLLSGGLDCDNIRTAIRTLKPRGVDVSSGVESALGKKDPSRIRRFIRLARDAAREGVA